MSRSHETDEQERKLFVGGLSRDDTNEDELRQFFETYGKIVDVTVMRDQERRSRGFGFVLFDDTAAVDKIMSLKRDGADFVVNNNTVQIKRALPQVPGGKAVAPRSDFRKIFVGGLPIVISEEDLKTYFEQFGRVTQVDLLRDKETKALKGFAFITFEDEDVADKCIQRRNHEICRKVCDVKRATFKSRDLQQNRPTTDPVGGKSAGSMPIEEVNRLIQQAFLMGQQSGHGSQSSLQAQIAAASLLNGVAKPQAPSSNNILMQALLNIAAPAPAPAPPPLTGVEKIAQVLQNSGVDANALAALLKGGT